MMKKFIIPLLIFTVFLGGLAFKLNFIFINHQEVDTIVIQGSYPYYDLENLIEKADLIVQGTVNDIAADKWNNENNKKPEVLTSSDIIFSDISFEVKNSIKGNAKIGNKVVIRTFGGEKDGFKVINSTKENFKKGEESIIFLVKDNSSYNKAMDENHYIILGAEQGIYRIDDEQIRNVHGQLSLKDFNNKIKNTIK